MSNKYLKREPVKTDDDAVLKLRESLRSVEKNEGVKAGPLKGVNPSLDIIPQKEDEKAIEKLNKDVPVVNSDILDKGGSSSITTFKIKQGTKAKLSEIAEKYHCNFVDIFKLMCDEGK